MRTTVQLDEHLLQQAKQHAVATGKTLTAVLEQALRESLARRPAGAQVDPVRRETLRGAGLRPGVDLDDSAALLNVMADEDVAKPGPGRSLPAARHGGPGASSAAFLTRPARKEISCPMPTWRQWRSRSSPAASGPPPTATSAASTGCGGDTRCDRQNASCQGVRAALEHAAPNALSSVSRAGASPAR